MTDRQRVLAAVGAGAVLVSAVLFLAPGFVEGAVPVTAVVEATALSEAGVRALVVGLVGAGCLLWVVSASGETAEPGFPAVEESATAPTATVGGGFDRNLERTLAAAADPDRDAVRADLRSLAVDVVAGLEGCSRTRAGDLIADGGWTDDPVAAAYLADEEDALPLHRRLHGRLRPRAVRRRRIERTVRAIEALVGEADR